MGDSTEVAQKKPGEEFTIARPIQRRGPLTFTFTHRKMYSITNFPTPFDSVNPVATTQFTNSWLRTQLKCLPVKAAIWWMIDGEINLIFQFKRMKFVEADFHIHNMSFRTQFITGDSSPGYANSNMQMHGYIVDEADDKLPPYGIWSPAGKPVANEELNGYDIFGYEWPQVLANGTSSYTQQSGYQFIPLPYVPWFYCGQNRISPGVANMMWPDISQDTAHQLAPNLLRYASIVGKKIPEIHRKYNLAGHWHNKWIPVRPHLYDKDDSPGFDYTTHFPQLPGHVGSWAPFFGYMNDKGSLVQQRNRPYDIHVIPPHDTFEYQDPSVDSVQSVGGSANLFGGAYGAGAAKGKMNSFLIGVEHLQNADGSLVPIIWDFYVDTNIVVQVDYESGVWPLNGAEIQLIVPGTGNEKAPIEAYYVVNPNQAIANDSHSENIYTKLSGISSTHSQSSAPRSLGGFGARYPIGNNTNPAISYNGAT